VPAEGACYGSVALTDDSGAVGVAR
jgi:hypothetical protein